MDQKLFDEIGGGEKSSLEAGTLPSSCDERSRQSAPVAPYAAFMTKTSTSDEILERIFEEIYPILA